MPELSQITIAISTSIRFKGYIYICIYIYIFLDKGLLEAPGGCKTSRTCGFIMTLAATVQGIFYRGLQKMHLSPKNAQQKSPNEDHKGQRLPELRTHGGACEQFVLNSRVHWPVSLGSLLPRGSNVVPFWLGPVYL